MRYIYEPFILKIKFHGTQKLQLKVKGVPVGNIFKEKIFLKKEHSKNSSHLFSAL